MNSQLHSPTAIKTDGEPVHVAFVWSDVAARLREAGVDTAELDARLLVCHACAMSHETFVASPRRPLEASERVELERLVRRRCAREPVSRIIGRREFWGLEFAIGSGTLDPRPDTETLVAAALELVKQRGMSRPLRILDLGTGSGCILVSLLRELPHATGVGVDINRAALALARGNALAHGCAGRASFVCTSWADGLASEFDLVVANPPYIRTGDLGQLQPEVRLYDPPCALDGGTDGLDAYRQIVYYARDVCAQGGWLVFEIGDGQDDQVAGLMAADGAFAACEVRRWRDLAGKVRCIAG
jgi:release factor glutamine methyltransferase